MAAETVADIVEVIFRATGQQDVARAFESIEKRMAQFERANSQSSVRGGRERVSAADAERRDREATYKKLFDEIAAKEKAATKAVDQASKEKARAEANSARERLRQEEALARQKDRIRENSAAYAGRLAEQQANAEIRAADRASRERERLAKRDEEESRRRNTRIGGTVGGIVGNAVGRTMGTLASLGSSALAIGGGFSVANAIGGELDAERAAALLVNVVTTGKTPPQGANVGGILGKAGVVAGETGLKRSEVVGSALEYARNARGGDFAGAMANMGFFAKMAKVTGADINQIAGAAGKLQSQNADLKAPEMQQMLLAAYAQSKQGSVSFSDAAQQIGTLAMTRGYYQGDTANNQRKLLALGQIAASGGMTGDVGTYIKDLSVEAAAHRKSTATKQGLESMGVKFNAVGQMESPEQMIGAVFKGTKGDLGKIHDIFENLGMPLFTELQKSFLSAGGGDKGVKAVQEQIAQVTKANMSPEDMEAQFAQTMSTNAEKLAVAMEKLNAILAEKGVPILDRFVTALSEHMPEIERGISKAAEWFEWFAEHPATGIGALILANITKDLLSAGIGAGVRTILTGILNQISDMRSKTPGDNAGNAAAITAGLTIAAATGTAVVGSAKGGTESGSLAVQQIFSDLNETRTAVKEGKVSPEEAEKKIRDVQGLIATAEDKGGTAAGVLAGVSAPLALVSPGARKDIASYNYNKEIVDNAADLARSLKLLKTAAEEAAKAQKGAAAPPSIGGGNADPNALQRKPPPNAHYSH